MRLHAIRTRAAVQRVIPARTGIRPRTLTMLDREEELDPLVQLNRVVLKHAGTLRADVAEKLALKRFEYFDAARREAARLEAEAKNMAVLERTGRRLEGKGREKKG